MQPIQRQPTHVVVFSHGGTVRPDTNLQSQYLSLMILAAKTAGINLTIVAQNHRNSVPDQDGIPLSSRRQEIIASHMIAKYFFENTPIVWAGLSIGGASIIAGELKRKTILTQMG